MYSYLNLTISYLKLYGKKRIVTVMANSQTRNWNVHLVRAGVADRGRSLIDDTIRTDLISVIHSQIELNKFVQIQYDKELVL